MSDDLWLDAREKTKKLSKPSMIEQIISSVSFPGKPTKLKFSTFTNLISENRAIVIDLNSYRQNFNVKAAYEAGCRHFILRIAYPAVYQADAWKLTEDSTYRRYFTEIKALGPDVTIGGYAIYVAGIDRANYETSKILLNFVRQCIGGGFKPDYLIADDEVNYWWEGSRKVYAPAHNQVKGVKWLTSDFRDHLGLPAMHYSAMWFINQVIEGSSYKSEYALWFDTENAGQNNGSKNVANWWAWWPYSYTKVYQSPSSVISDQIIPTSTQQNNFLQCGSYALADLWQMTDRLLTPWNNPATQGVDCSVTYISEPSFLKQIKRFPLVPPTEPPSDQEPPVVDINLVSRIEKLEEKVNSLNTWASSFNNLE